MPPFLAALHEKPPTEIRRWRAPRPSLVLRFVSSGAVFSLGRVMDPLRRGTAEFVGAFTLIFAGAGSIMAAAGVHDPTLVGIALAHGLAIAVMVSALGHISGGHFNPAVTLGFLVTRPLATILAVVYWVAQLAGATIAALLLKWVFPDAAVDAPR